MANEAFETERARIRGESPKSVLGISPAERWGSAAGALASALVAHRMGKSPIAAGVSAYGGGIKGAIGRRADELSAQYKQSQMRNEQDRMAASLTKPTQSTRIEGEEVVSQRYTTAGGMEDVGRGPRFSPTARTAKVAKPISVTASNQKLAREDYYSRVAHMLNVPLEDIGDTGLMGEGFQINNAKIKRMLATIPDRKLAKRIMQGEQTVIQALSKGASGLEASSMGASFVTGQPTETGRTSLSREAAMKMIQENPDDF